MRDTCRQHRLVGFATIPSHQMSHDAFISYSTHDKAAADATCAALEGSGIRCWIAPRDIVPGAEWGEAIIEGINHCRVLILIFSANANDSPQIRREVERAVSKGVPIIPLRIQDIAPTRSLEYFIGTVHWLDALTPPAGDASAPARRNRESTFADRSRATAHRLAEYRLRLSGIVDRSKRPRSGRNCIDVSRVDRRCDRTLAVCCGDAGTAGSRASVDARAACSSAVKPSVDPVLVGTFEHEGVVDDYDWRLIYSIEPSGSYRLVTTAEEDGTW